MFGPSNWEVTLRGRLSHAALKVPAYESLTSAVLKYVVMFMLINIKLL